MNAVPFDPTGHIPWGVAAANETFLDVETENVHELNVHSIANYLLNPAVHIPVLERLCGNGSVLASEKQQAFDDFEDIPDATVEAAFDDLIAKHEGTKWVDLIGKLYAHWGSSHA